MAKLTTEKRKQMKDSDFGIPSKRMYPLWNTGSEESDRKHVMSAVRLFGHAADEDKPELARNILKRAKELNIDSSGWDQINAWAKKKTNKAESDKSSSDVKKECYILLSEFSHYFREYYDSEIEALFEECDELIEDSELIMMEEVHDADDESEVFEETYKPYDEWLRLHKYDPQTNTVIVNGRKTHIGEKGSKKERNRINKFLRENDFDPKTETIATTDEDGNPVRRRIGAGFAHPDSDPATVKQFTGNNHDDSLFIGSGREHTAHSTKDSFGRAQYEILIEIQQKFGNEADKLKTEIYNLEQKLDYEDLSDSKKEQLQRKLSDLGIKYGDLQRKIQSYIRRNAGEHIDSNGIINMALETMGMKPEYSNMFLNHESGHIKGHHIGGKRTEKHDAMNKQGEDFVDFTRERLRAAGKGEEYQGLVEGGHFSGEEFTADELGMRSNPHSKKGKEVGNGLHKGISAIGRSMIKKQRRLDREDYADDYEETRKEIEEDVKSLREEQADVKKQQKDLENALRDPTLSEEDRKTLEATLKRRKIRAREIQKEIKDLLNPPRSKSDAKAYWDSFENNTPIEKSRNETEYRKQYASLVNAQEHERHMAEQRRRNERMIERLQTQIDSGKLDPKQLEKAKKKLSRLEKFMDMGEAAARSRSTKTGGVRQKPSKSSVKREKRERRDAEWLRQGQELKKQFDEFRANGNQLTAKQERELSKRK